MNELKWASFVIFMTGAVGNLVLAIMDTYTPQFTLFLILGLLGGAIHAALKEVIEEGKKQAVNDPQNPAVRP